MEETEMHGSEKRGGREDTPVSRRYSLTVTRNRMRSRDISIIVEARWRAKRNSVS